MDVNLSLFKNFRFEKSSLHFRWEAFNALNHPKFDLPDVNVNQQTAATIKSAGPGRLMQFGLRYIF